MTALLDGASALIESFEVILHVSQLMTNPIDSQSGSASRRIKSCCSDRGVVQIQVSLTKNAYVPGEKAELIAEINNSQSTMDVSGLRVRLLRKLRLSCYEGESHVRQEVMYQWDLAQIVRRGEALLGKEANAIYWTLKIQREVLSTPPLSIVNMRSVSTLW